jgi:hypothetical protein
MRPDEAFPIRIYRRLLVLYPAAFRARYGDEMVQLFGDQWRDAQHGDGSGGTARTWLRTIRDLIVTAAAEHLTGGRDRTQRTMPPSASSRLLGIFGIVGGLVLVAAFLPDLPWTREVFQLRLVLFNLGAIAVAIAVHRHQVALAPRASLAAAGAVVLANAWYLVMVVLSSDRPQPPVGDPDFRLVGFYAGVAMWWADATFGLVAWRLRSVTRWGALALAVGSVLAFLGMDRLELVNGDVAWLFTPVALLGVALNGVGWVLLGIDVAFRWRTRPVTRPGESDPT